MFLDIGQLALGRQVVNAEKNSEPELERPDMITLLMRSMRQELFFLDQRLNL